MEKFSIINMHNDIQGRGSSVIELENYDLLTDYSVDLSVEGNPRSYRTDSREASNQKQALV